jgi:hypothetical protein
MFHCVVIQSNMIGWDDIPLQATHIIFNAMTLLCLFVCFFFFFLTKGALFIMLNCGTGLLIYHLVVLTLFSPRIISMGKVDYDEEIVQSLRFNFLQS